MPISEINGLSQVVEALTGARTAQGCEELVKAVHGLTNTLVPFLEKAADRSELI